MKLIDILEKALINRHRLLKQRVIPSVFVWKEVLYCQLFKMNNLKNIACILLPE